jgi:tRNA pseudouridine13 synthase
MLFSAARAYLFNQVLSERIHQANWSRFVPGDVLNLGGTSRYFILEEGCWDEKLQQRLDGFDIHISGPLAGKHAREEKYISTSMAAGIEDEVLAKFQPLIDGLTIFGLKAARRPLRFVPTHLEWHWPVPQELKLQFTLPRGAYATSLLRELCTTN